MTRDAFHQEMRALEEAVVQMASLVEAALANAVQALIQRQVELAEQVIAADATVNEHQRLIRTQTVGVIARQAPVARDLRALVTMQLVINELERMGDHAVDVAKNAIRLAGLAPITAVGDLPALAQVVRQQMREAIQALVGVNVVAARQICARDDAVDQLYRQLFEELLVRLRDPEQVPQATSLLFVAHSLERVGDRVTNICEDLIFMVTGEIEELN